MYLKNVSVAGFKSFGAKNVLDFPESGKDKSRSFAAVVGPNGSGKSNIADAIRWVLGEQSTKLLRIKKNEDVIFFGSSKKGRGSFTEVSLTLDNSHSCHSRGGGNPVLKGVDSYLHGNDSRTASEYGAGNGIDLTEIEIARRLYRNGDNDYFLNRRKVRLLDIQELLAKCGFGRSTYTVIGQGMVDSLLFYGPSERKVLFEEASGVKQYEIKRGEALRKLDSTDKNIIRIKDLLNELEPRLKTTKRQFKKFQKKKDIETELDALSRKYYTNVLADITGKKSDFRTKLEKLRSEERSLKSEITAIESKIAKGLKAQGSDKEEKELKVKLDELSAKKNDISQKIYKIQAESEAVQSVYVREKDSLVREKESLEREIANLRERSYGISTESVTEKLKKAKQELEKIDGKIICANEKLARAQRESVVMGKGDIAKELEILSGEYKKIVTQINMVKDLKSLAALKSEAEVLNQKMDELVSKIRKSTKADTSNIEQKQDEISRLTENKEIILKEIQDLRVKEISQAETLKSIESQIKDYSSRLEIVTEKVLKLERPAEKDSSEINKLNTEKVKIESEISLNKEKLEKIEGQSSSGDYSKILEDEKAKRAEISRVADQINSCMVELARVETKSDDLKSEIHEFLGESFYKEILSFSCHARTSSCHSREGGNPASESVENLMPKIQRLRKDMYALGEIDTFVGEEFEELRERVVGLKEQYEDLEKAKGDILKVIGELDTRIKTQFKTTFIKISEEFTKYFKILFSGGNAALNLETDEEGNFGVEITATPPGKKNQSLNSLSGGERALTSIALLFAILSVNPSPFCVLDEVDASLDETNTERFLEILKALSHKTQFVVVTHNRETMKKADIIYGVSMDDNHVSQVYSLKLTEV